MDPHTHLDLSFYLLKKGGALFRYHSGSLFRCHSQLCGNPERRGGPGHFLMAIPSLIVEAPLFVSWFDSTKEKFVVKKVPYGRLSWEECRGGTAIDVVHISSVKEYAQAMKITFSKTISVILKLLS